MSSEAVDQLVAPEEIGHQRLDDWAVLPVKKTLADHAGSEVAEVLVVDARAGELANGVLQPRALRAEDLIDEVLEHRRGIRHLARHELPVPARPARVEETREQCVNEVMDAFLGREMPGLLGREGARGLVRVHERGGVEFLLVAKVVVHRRDVHPRAARDLADRRGMVAVLGKDFARRLDQTRLRAGFLVHSGNDTRHARNFKQLF